MPKLRWLTRRQARKKLKRAGCAYRFRGRGRVRSTVPRRGKITRNTVTVRLAPRHPAGRLLTPR